MQLKEAVVESNSGDTALPIGEIPTNQRATEVGSSGGGLPPEMTEDARDCQVQETPPRILVPYSEEGQAQPNHLSRHNVMHDTEGIGELSSPREMDCYTSRLKDSKCKKCDSESEDSAGCVHGKRNSKLRHRRRSYSRSDSDTSEVEYRQRRVRRREKRECIPRTQRKGRSYSPEIQHRRRVHKDARHRRDYNSNSQQSYSSGSSSDSRRRLRRRSSHHDYGRRTHTCAHAPLDKYRSSTHRHFDLKRTHSMQEREHKTGRSCNPPSSDTESGREPICAEEMMEAAKRKDRRERKAEADRMTAQKERKGLKPWTLSVTPGGVPYGPSTRHWREEIRKLATVHFDPSCRNIKMQDSADMATFKEALELNIEYTQAPLDNIIQTLAGRAVVVRRN